MKNLQLTSCLIVKDWLLSPEIKNKAKMSIPTASIQYYPRSPSWCNKAIKRNK